MELKTSFDAGPLLQQLDAAGATFRDLKPLLRRFAGILRQEARIRFATGGPGWAPLAESTVEERAHRFTGRITKLGTLRASYAAARQRQRTGRLLQVLRRGESKTGPRLLQYLQRYDAGTAKLQAAAKRQQQRAMEARKSGVTVAAKEAAAKQPLLGRLRSSLVVDLEQSALVVRSRVPWAGVHNEGGAGGHGATIPARPFLFLEPEDEQRLAAVAEDYFAEKLS